MTDLPVQPEPIIPLEIDGKAVCGQCGVVYSWPPAHVCPELNSSANLLNLATQALTAWQEMADAADFAEFPFPEDEVTKAVALTNKFFLNHADYN